MSLSKSRYCKGIQCPKILWLDEHKSEAGDNSVMNKTVLDTGNMVGDMAMGYYGDYVEVPYDNNKQVMLTETRRLLDTKAETICEASFSYDNNFCSVDILRILDYNAVNNYVEIIEVKSSVGIKPIYYHDMAYQYYVLTSCGFNVSKISIMHLNNKYERQGNLDLKKLFIVHDCTEKVRSMQDNIAANIEYLKKITKNENEPEIDIGEYCSVPYECIYQAYCWKHIPEHSIFDISGTSMHFDKKLNLYNRGIITYKQLLDSGEKLSENVRLQAEAKVFNSPPFINKEAIRAFLDTLKWPIYFLDFETFQEAVPSFDNMRPFMQIPFQYSLHIQEYPGGQLVHREYLAEAGIDPRRCFTDRICSEIPKNSCILSYNMSFEKIIIKDLAGLFTDRADHLMNIHECFIDLMKPFQSRAYYSHELGNSYSLKYVLPVLCPDDPELDYNSLDLVHKGTDAQTAYKELSGKNPEEQQRIRNALLSYCRLDTLAMVKILEKLIEISSD